MMPDHSGTSPDFSPVIASRSSGPTSGPSKHINALIYGSGNKKSHTTPPPFRPGGRGSKQLSKAIEQSKEQETFDMIFCTKTSSFARVISTLTQDTNSVLIQVCCCASGSLFRVLPLPSHSPSPSPLHQHLTTFSP